VEEERGDFKGLKGLICNEFSLAAKVRHLGGRGEG